MDNQAWYCKSLPEIQQTKKLNENIWRSLRKKNDKNNGKSSEKTRIINEISKIKAVENCDKCLLTRSRSAIFTSKMPVIYDEKTLDLQPSQTIECVINNSRKRPNSTEEELDSGLCSAAEDSENHLNAVKKIEVASKTDEQVEDFNTELKMKAKEMKERLRRRQTARLYRYKPTIIRGPRYMRHGSLQNESSSYNTRSSKLKYTNNFKSTHSFNTSIDDRIENGKLDYCVEIKEEETITANEADGELKTTPNIIEPVVTTGRNVMHSLESSLHRSFKQNLSPSAANAIATAAAAATAVPTNDEALQKLIDIVMPPLIISSNFDISASSDVAELSLMMHQHLNEATAKMEFNVLNRKQPDIEANEHIMRTCLGYLDYINKKHMRERQLKVIRNKISGVVLLAIVFIMIFGLGIIISIYLVKSFADMMRSGNDYSKSSFSNSYFELNQTFIYYQNGLNFSNFNTTSDYIVKLSHRK